MSQHPGVAAFGGRKSKLFIFLGIQSQRNEGGWGGERVGEVSDYIIHFIRLDEST